MSQKTHLSFRLKPETAAALEAAAIADRRPVSQYLCNLVEDVLAQRRVSYAAKDERGAA